MSDMNQNPPPNAPQTPPQTVPPAGEADKDARLWGMLCHLTALAGFIVPFGNVIGPLVIWLIKKDTIPFANRQGKESLNFQITVTIIAIVAGLTVLCGIGFVLLPIIGIANLVFVIIASMKANQGIEYRYPWALRLVK